MKRSSRKRSKTTKLLESEHQAKEEEDSNNEEVTTEIIPQTEHEDLSDVDKEELGAAGLLGFGWTNICCNGNNTRRGRLRSYSI